MLDKSQLTPLMKQYLQIKSEHKDKILLYRMGDFYETFFDDAKTISKILGIALTKRSHGKGGDAPLAGFPYHALENYLPKLIDAGQKVAICEQVEDPKKAKVVVKREVIEVITPGTTLSEKLLENKRNNYLCSLHLYDEKASVSYIDVSTGEFHVAVLDIKEIEDFLHTFSPKEIVVAKGQKEEIKKMLQKYGEVLYSVLDDWLFTYDYSYEQLTGHFKVKNLKGYGIEDNVAAIITAGVIIHYLTENYKQQLEHITHLTPIHLDDYMFLDEATRKNLEITSGLASGNKEGSLIAVIDDTQTPMGGRLLKQWLNKPLINAEMLLDRQKNVDFFHTNETFTMQVQDHLAEISDLERMAARLATGRLNPRELIFLKRTLQTVVKIDELFKSDEKYGEFKPDFFNLFDVIELIDKSINEDAPLNIKEGNIIKKGYSSELDELKALVSSGKDWIAKYQQKEREKTGITSLKVGYNRVFGYYLEVTSVHKNKVPEEYIRKQTLTNAERYITPELKEYEDKILGAEEKIAALEYELFIKIRDEIAAYIPQIQKNAELIAKIDLYANFAQIARKNGYVKPEITDEKMIRIIEGRHPVVEHFLP